MITIAMSRQLNNINILTDSWVSVCTYLAVNQLHGWPIILHQPICLIYLLQCDVICPISLSASSLKSIGAYHSFYHNVAKLKPCSHLKHASISLQFFCQMIFKVNYSWLVGWFGESGISGIPFSTGMIAS